MGLPARKLIPDAEKRLEEVSLSLDGKRIIFLFENGEGYSIWRSALPGDDGTIVTALQVFDHRHAVAVSQASGATYDLPWDSIKHYARGGRQRIFSFGQKLKELREARGLSQEGLARAATLSRMQLIRLEKENSQPSLETLLKLSNVLGVVPQTFFK